MPAWRRQQRSWRERIGIGREVRWGTGIDRVCVSQSGEVDFVSILFDVPLIDWKSQ